MGAQKFMGAQKLLRGHDASASLRYPQMAPGIRAASLLGIEGSSLIICVMLSDVNLQYLAWHWGLLSTVAVESTQRRRLKDDAEKLAAVSWLHLILYYYYFDLMIE